MRNKVAYDHIASYGSILHRSMKLDVSPMFGHKLVSILGAEIRGSAGHPAVQTTS
jgi:hypothetical protein